jgi:hypothetical protein
MPIGAEKKGQSLALFEPLGRATPPAPLTDRALETPSGFDLGLEPQFYLEIQ